MIANKRIVAVLVGIILTQQLIAQQIDTALQRMSRIPQEKIYIHYDKEYYVAGETIWMKAYLYNEGRPSMMSTNFYLQLTDSKGRIVSTKKYPILGAAVRGNIDLPDTLPQGNYYIRALTPDMLNYDEAFIYKKDVFVFNPANKSKDPVQAKQVSLKFFPESGHLIEGIINVVAFKATDQWGMPVNLNGVIKTAEGTTIVSFNSYHDGIGKVQFKPMAGKKYAAEVEMNGGTRTFPLPEVEESGINLKIQDEKGGKLFQLTRSEKGKDAFNPVHIVVEMNNRIVYDNEINFEDYPSVKGHLITDSLPSGILHFTLFNKDNVPLAERISFVNNREYVTNGSIDVVKAGLEKKAENVIELSFPEAMQRSASVSITDIPRNNYGSEDNIYSRLLLTSDLRGYVHNPSYYFSNASDSVQQALDNLMLTHGWSRFSWKKILANEFPQKRIVDGSLLYFNATVKEGKDKPALKGGSLNIYTEGEDSTSQSFEVNVNSDGRFQMDSMVFFGKTKFYYVYSDNKGKMKPGFVFIDDNPLQGYVETIPNGITESNGAVQPGSVSNEEINQRVRQVKSKLDEVKELERAIVKTSVNKKPIDIVNEKYTTGVFRTMGKENIDNINEPVTDKSLNAVDFIKNRVPQLEIQNGQFVNRKNVSLLTGKKWLVQAFLDQNPVDLSALRVVRADQIAMVKFYEAGFVGVGSSAPGGAVAVFTKETNTPPKIDKFEFVEYNGYSITKEFYNPDYNSPDARKDIADNRTTLYWNPDVYTDMENKKVKVNFFNNDFSKKYRVVVEGFDAMGKLIHIEKIVGGSF